MHNIGHDYGAASAIVFDPGTPEAIKRELEQAPFDQLISYSASPPAVVPPPSAADLRQYVPTSDAMHARRSGLGFGACVALFVLGFTFSGMSYFTQVWFFASIILGVVFGVFRSRASDYGWREPSSRLYPGDPQWIGRHAVTA